MLFGVILVLAQVYAQIRYKYRNINDLSYGEPSEIQELRHEIAIWEKAAESMVTYSRDEDLVQEALFHKRDMLEERLQHSLIGERTTLNNHQFTVTLA